MKYKFNDSNMGISIIKEVLKNFNLPSYRVYKDGLQLNEGRSYIKDLTICEYKNNKLQDRFMYKKGLRILNITSNLNISSTIYDNKTHLYLGKYLRFLKDYNKLNLMPLYNCVLDEEPVINFVTNDNVVFNSNDNEYNYYMANVRFCEDYTIAIDSNKPYEIICVPYSGRDRIRNSSDLMNKTYMKIPGSVFQKPFLYSSLRQDKIRDEFDKYWKEEENLRLIIKLPKGIHSSITVLEGDYTSNYDCGFGVLINNVIVSSKDKDDSLPNNLSIPQPCKLSLLSLNDKVIRPFAPRLIEYMLNNVITPIEKITHNVGRLQRNVYKKDFKGSYDEWSEELYRDIYNKLEKDSDVKISNLLRKLDSEEYKTIRSNNARFIDLDYDLLSFGDSYTDYILKGEK